jgi:hypothetical protein
MQVTEATEEAATVNLAEPIWDPILGQYVAVALTRLEVYGDTWEECFGKLVGANECAIAHAAHCPDDDPFAPDWEALAEWEPMTASAQDRDSAGYP